MRYLNISPATNLGGHPFSLNDLDHVQGGVFDLMQAMSSMGHDDFGTALLQPVEFFNETPTTFDHNGFWFIHFGGAQVVRVPARTGVAKSGDPAAKYYLRTTFGSGPGNPVVYEAGASHNVHVQTTSEIVHTHQPGGNDLLLSAFNISGYRDNGQFSVQGLTVNSFAARYRLVNGNTMLLHLNIDGTVTAPVVVTMPKPYLSRNKQRDLMLLGQTTCVAHLDPDSDLIPIKWLNGNDFSVNTVIGINAMLTFEVKLRDSW